MFVLFWSLLLFIAAFLLHLIIWKIRIPRRQTNTLLGIFFGIYILGILLFVRPEFFEGLYIFVFFASLTLAYIITYSAVEVDSPSLSLVMAFNKSASFGLSRENISEFMTDEKLVIPRINDLVRDKLIYVDSGKYKLTAKGKNFIIIFILYRKLLGAQKGG